MNILAELVGNKMLLFGIAASVAFIAIAIILIKKFVSEDNEEETVKVEIEKIDGDNSIFDEILEEKEKNNSTQLDLDSMIAKMQADLDAKASEVVEKFENEQEEKSVISYKELIENKKEEVPVVEVNNISDDISETMVSTDENYIPKKEEVINTIETDNTIDTYTSNLDENEYLETENLASTVLDKLNIIADDTKEKIDSVNTEDTAMEVSKLNMKDEFVEAIKTGKFEEKETKVEDDSNHSKFKATEFISPIYGVQDIKMQYPTVQNMKEFKENYNKYNKFELDDTLNINKIDKEIHKDEDFLNTLKEFRKNLE